MKNWIRMLVAVGMLSVFTVAPAGAEAINYGKETVVNGGFDLEEDHAMVPRGWTRSVIPANKAADVKVESANGNSVLKIRFHSPGYVTAARLFQKITVEPGKVYELSFRYKTTTRQRLFADVLLTGTGPLYRSYYHAPVTQWTKRRVYFHIPEHEKAEAAIYIQNRSAATIWYDNISLRATDIPPQMIDRYQPSIQVQSVSTDDQLLFPDSQKTTADFIVKTSVPADMMTHLAVSPWLMTSDGRYVEVRSDGDKILVDTSLVSDGVNQLFVFLVDRRDQAQLAYARLEIERVADDGLLAGDIDLKKSMVFRDRDGKPLFPIGMYGVGRLNTGEELDELYANGFNTIHNYAFEGDPGDRMERHHRFLDRAQRHGLKVMVGFPRRLAEKPGHTDELAEWINKLKDHPANLFYTSDEMSIMRHVPKSQFAAVKQVIDRADPDRQWIIYDIPNDTFSSHVDGIMLVLNSEISAKLIRVRMDKPLVFAVWGQSQYKAAYAPSEDEVRYAVFMPVILGARGWFYWWYETLKHHNVEKDLLKNRLFRQTRLLAEIGPALVSEESSPMWVTDINASGGVKYCTGTRDEMTYVIAGVPNGSKDGRLMLPVLENHTTEVMGREGGKAGGEDFSLNIKEGEIVIMRIKRENTVTAGSN